MRKQKKPVVINELLVENYAAEGKSLARVDGKVIFIENVVPGDVADVQLFKNKKDWAEGFPLRFHKFSEERVVPFCEHFGVCGGCQWQMLPYKKQLEYKQQQVNDVLQRIGKVQLPEIFPIIGCDETKFYRNKLEYSFSTKQFIPEDVFRNMIKDGIDTTFISQKNVAGFYAKGVFDKVVEIKRCYLQPEPTNEIRNAIAEFARNNDLPFYDFRQHAGWLRNLMVRITTTGEVMLNIVIAAHDEHKMNLLFDFVLSSFPQITTLLYSINSKRNDSIFDLHPQVVNGNGFIIEKLEDFSFKISAKSFFQTNTLQAEKLYQTARNFAELNNEKTVYDLYCGTGSIGIFVSRQAKKVIGVEMIHEAIVDAKENAALNNIYNTSFYTGDVSDICTHEFFAANGNADVIIVDPPRAGLPGELTQTLLAVQSPLIVYVSCNPATQARDLHLLSEKYSVEKVQPVDMFPHTHHIENVVQLKIKD